jgi:hypothetical protein
MPNGILRRNAIIAAMVNNLNITLLDVDAVQRRLDFIRAKIAENSTIYADAAPRLARGSRRLAEAMFAHLAAAARHTPPESEEEEEEQQQQQKTHTLPAEELDEEEMEELAAALAARFAQVAARVVQNVQEGGRRLCGSRRRVARWPRSRTSTWRSRSAWSTAVVQAHAFLLVVRGAAFAITRACLLPGVLVSRSPPLTRLRTSFVCSVSCCAIVQDQIYLVSPLFVMFIVCSSIFRTLFSY